MPVTANIDTAHVILTSTTALVMDNIEHADPADPIARAIKKITDKGSDMTDEDRQRKDQLAYRACLYLETANGSGPQIMVPARLLTTALGKGAYAVGGASLSGKVNAGVFAPTTAWPLLYKGPQDPDELFADERFRLRLMVNKNPSGKKAMVPYVRPIFPAWQLDIQLKILNEVISWDQFIRAVEATGMANGIGNARKLGYGRFTAEISRS